MGIIKKFRIKSFKKKFNYEFDKVSLSFGNRLILDNISFKINRTNIWYVGIKWLGNRQF